jgi:hypothetical protein
MTFPVELRDIDRFERLNPKYAVNVYGIENGKDIYSLRVFNLISHLMMVVTSVYFFMRSITV